MKADDVHHVTVDLMLESWLQMDCHWHGTEPVCRTAMHTCLRMTYKEHFYVLCIWLKPGFVKAAEGCQQHQHQQQQW